MCFQVRETCLLFLRIAALLKSHLMEENSPVIADPIAECGALEQYLGVWDICSVVNSAIMGKCTVQVKAGENDGKCFPLQIVLSYNRNVFPFRGFEKFFVCLFSFLQPTGLSHSENGKLSHVYLFK